MDEKLTITLTDRSPVRIKKESWPIVAQGTHWSDGGMESQANRRWTLTVRQNADGRAIVYGVHTTSQWQGESGSQRVRAAIRGGQFIPAGDNIPAAVCDVAARLGFADEIVQRCIAELPAEEL